MAENSGNIDTELHDLITEALDRSDAEKKRIDAEKKRIKSKIKGAILEDDIDPTHRTLRGFGLRNKNTKIYDVEGPFQFSYELILVVCKILHSRHPDVDFCGMGSCFSRRKRLAQGHEIPGTGIYVRTQINNKAAVAFCYNLIRSFGYDKSDLYICLSHSKN